MKRKGRFHIEIVTTTPIGTTRRAVWPLLFPTYLEAWIYARRHRPDRNPPPGHQFLGFNVKPITITERTTS